MTETKCTKQNILADIIFFSSLGKLTATTTLWAQHTSALPTSKIIWASPKNQVSYFPNYMYKDPEGSRKFTQRYKKWGYKYM